MDLCMQNLSVNWVVVVVVDNKGDEITSDDVVRMMYCLARLPTEILTNF